MACSCPKKMYSGLAAFAFVFVNKFLDAGRGALRRAQAGMCGAARACVPRSRGGAWRRLSTLLLAAVLGLNLPARSGAQYKAGAACSGYAHRWQATDSSVSGSTVLDTGTGPQANAVLTGTATYNSTGGLFTVQGSPAGYLTLGSLNFTCAPRRTGLCTSGRTHTFSLFLHPPAQPWLAPVRSQYTIAFWARIDPASAASTSVLFSFADAVTNAIYGKYNPSKPYWYSPSLTIDVFLSLLSHSRDSFSPTLPWVPVAGTFTLNQLQALAIANRTVRLQRSVRPDRGIIWPQPSKALRPAA